VSKFLHGPPKFFRGPPVCDRCLRLSTVIQVPPSSYNKIPWTYRVPQIPSNKFADVFTCDQLFLRNAGRGRDNFVNKDTTVTTLGPTSQGWHHPHHFHQVTRLKTAKVTWIMYESCIASRRTHRFNAPTRSCHDPFLFVSCFTFKNACTFTSVPHDGFKDTHNLSCPIFMIFTIVQCYMM
jgi:hypothetical protein